VASAISYYRRARDRIGAERVLGIAQAHPQAATHWRSVLQTPRVYYPPPDADTNASASDSESGGERDSTKSKSTPFRSAPRRGDAKNRYLTAQPWWKPSMSPSNVVHNFSLVSKLEAVYRDKKVQCDCDCDLIKDRSAIVVYYFSILTYISIYILFVTVMGCSTNGT